MFSIHGIVCHWAVQPVRWFSKWNNIITLTYRLSYWFPVVDYSNFTTKHVNQFLVFRLFSSSIAFFNYLFSIPFTQRGISFLLMDKKNGQFKSHHRTIVFFDTYSIEESRFFKPLCIVNISIVGCCPYIDRFPW